MSRIEDQALAVMGALLAGGGEAPMTRGALAASTGLSLHVTRNAITYGRTRGWIIVAPHSGRSVEYLPGITYEILLHGDRNEAFHCLLCGRTSYNLNDVTNLYCGLCHLHHSRTRRWEGAG